MKKIIRVVLSSFLVFNLIFLISCSSNGSITTSTLTTSTKDTEVVKKLAIIEMNDIHGYIMQDSNGKNGFSNMSYQVDEIRKELGEDHVLTIANGDMFQGTGLVKMSMGGVMIDALNAFKLDACGIGNHEFDWDLPEILKFFDGDKSNGEANFPLLNGNIYQNGSLLTIDGGKIYESYMFDKDGIKVGVISYIGDVKSSINDLFADKYTFDTNFSRLTQNIGGKLKENGADIIVVSIHDGNTEGVLKYNVNKELANLKYNDKYLVDAVINGHTHTLQKGEVVRPNGVAMPVIQSNGYRNGYLYSVGRIDLNLNKNNEVVSTEASHIYASDAGKNYNQKVEEVIDTYYEKDRLTLDKVYTVAKADINRYSEKTYEWVANLMLVATGADIAICNTGGIRATIKSGIVTFEDIYQMNPFDNHIVIHECEASKINEFVDSQYYFHNVSGGYKEAGETYKVAVIDYVYFGKYYKNLYTSDYNYTPLILRDLILADLDLRDEFNVNYDTTPKIHKYIID